MTYAEALVYKKFEDGIAQTNYPIDVHGMGDEYTCDTVKAEVTDQKPFYEIPYGSLVVKGVDNLLVAGRCIGCDFLVQASARIMPTCRATGEAAGIAASWPSGRASPLGTSTAETFVLGMIGKRRRFAQCKT